MDKKENENIKILHLEDSPEDAEIITSLIKKEIDNAAIYHAPDKAEFIRLLDESSPDIIICDYNIPGFDGFEALKISKNKTPDIPVIFFTGAIGEEMAVTVLKSGATDFILKNNPDRLVPAIFRAIEEHKTGIENRKLYRSLQQSEERYRTLMENLPTCIYRISVTEPSHIIHSNLTAALTHGYDSIESILDINPRSLYTSTDDWNRFLTDIVKLKKIKKRLIQFKKRDGDLFWGSLSSICHFDSNDEPVWADCVVEDITDRVNTERRLSEYLNFFETLVNTISSPVFYKDTNGRYLGCNRNFAEKIIGLPRDQIINKTVFDLKDAIPDNLAKIYNDSDIELFANPGTIEYDAKVKCADGKYRYFHFSKSTYSEPDGNTAGIVGILLDITEMAEKEIELNRINEEMKVLLESLPSIVIGVSTKDRITHWNRSAAIVFGIKSEDILGKRFYETDINWKWETIYEAIGNCIIYEKTIMLNDLKFEDRDGKIGMLGISVNPIKSDGDILEGFLILGKDITDQKIFERQLLQSSKLEAIGQLAAGVAHEINTPLQYVGDNLKFINKSVNGMIELLKICRSAIESRDDYAKLRELISHGEQMNNKIRLEFLIEEMPKALEQSLEGVTRVSRIVQSMKAFSHPGTGTKNPADINRAIQNTVTVSRNEWKYDAEIILDLDSALPEVPCFESEFNQVILNLIVNATDAIHEAIEKQLIKDGIITIKTMCEDPFAVIMITDNGSGIPENVRGKVFDPFFTTKEVGRGTGQGLPISHSIIVEKHGGQLYFETETGKGTTFIIKIPLE